MLSVSRQPKRLAAAQMTLGKLGVTAARNVLKVMRESLFAKMPSQLATKFQTSVETVTALKIPDMTLNASADPE